MQKVANFKNYNISMSKKGKEKVNYKLLDTEDNIKEHKHYASLVKH